jgi:hypothetical protein
MVETQLRTPITCVKVNDLGSRRGLPYGGDCPRYKAVVRVRGGRWRAPCRIALLFPNLSWRGSLGVCHAAASPRGSCPRGGGHRGRASPLRAAENRNLQVRASSFSPAVPPACHKQRSRAVCSGQSRSLETTVALGSGSLTWVGEEPETAWHARGQLRVVPGSVRSKLRSGEGQAGAPRR